MNWNSASSVQLVVRDLNEIAADAYRHRIRSRQKRGGNGVYDRSNGGQIYTLPSKFSINARARFEVTSVEADAVSLRAISHQDPACCISAVVDARGSLRSIMVPGTAPDPQGQTEDRKPIPQGNAFTQPQPAVRRALVFSEEQ